MLRFKIAFLLIVLVSCSCKAKYSQLYSEVYYISSEEDALSEKWRDYLFNHLRKRILTSNRIVKVKDNIASESYKSIHIEVAYDLKHDFCIEHSKYRLHLRVKEERTALWIIYQLIEKLSQEDKEINASDLPPGIIEFYDQCGDFDFEYREAHLSDNTDSEYSSILGGNNLDSDWGIWGHNLNSIVEGGSAVFSMVSGTINDQQFCFSSPALFNQIKEYVIDNYGTGESKSLRFMIAPNDNDLVCTCDSCLAKGNTVDNTTPALVNLLNRLADHFPKHLFYTIAYRTSYYAPEDPMLKNSGVLFSTIDLPKGKPFSGSADFEKFNKNVDKWRTKTKNIYIWDYISNFDDYLTPLPVTYGLKVQFPEFKNMGIKGVFLNGSGYDFAPFDDLKTFIASTLLLGVSGKSIDDLVREYFRKFYPVTGELLSKYYLGLEQTLEDRNKGYNLYGSFYSTVECYLEPQGFLTFYETLEKKLDYCGGEEKKKVVKLLTALTFTRLQIEYYYADKIYSKETLENVNKYLHVLSNYKNYDNMYIYKEFDGELSLYLKEWSRVINEQYKGNLLDNANITFTSTPDDGYEATACIKDGRPGFSIDYHQGWLINSQDEVVFDIESDLLNQSQRIEIRFLNSVKHSILMPDKVQLYDGSRLILELQPTVIEENIAMIRSNIHLKTKTNKLKIRMIKSKRAKSIALDELYFTK